MLQKKAISLSDRFWSTVG